MIAAILQFLAAFVFCITAVGILTRPHGAPQYFPSGGLARIILATLLLLPALALGFSIIVPFFAFSPELMLG